jgi:hypothetical protein
MHIGSAMTEIVPEADLEYVVVAEEYEEDVLIISVLKAFTNFLLSGSCLRQAPMHNPYFSTVIMFVCALSFEEKDTILNAYRKIPQAHEITVVAFNRKYSGYRIFQREQRYFF